MEKQPHAVSCNFIFRAIRAKWRAFWICILSETISKGVRRLELSAKFGRPRSHNRQTGWSAALGARMHTQWFCPALFSAQRTD